jgi:hypothetical protein
VNDDVWEPWTPVAGQRVRCVPSGECRYVGPPDTVAARNTLEPGHHPDEYGRMGFVLDLLLLRAVDPSWTVEPSHRFIVLWDEPLMLPNGESGSCSSYAAIELEPA